MITRSPSEITSSPSNQVRVAKSTGFRSFSWVVCLGVLVKAGTHSWIPGGLFPYVQSKIFEQSLEKMGTRGPPKNNSAMTSLWMKGFITKSQTVPPTSMPKMSKAIIAGDIHNTTRIPGRGMRWVSKRPRTISAAIAGANMKMNRITHKAGYLRHGRFARSPPQLFCAVISVMTC